MYVCACKLRFTALQISVFKYTLIEEANNYLINTISFNLLMNLQIDSLQKLC